MRGMYSAPPAVQLAGLTKRYGSRLAVDHLNLEVQSGEIFGFLGPNGSGKTTTIRLLLGLIRANSGRVRLFGEDLAAARQRVLPRVGSMVEQPGFHPYISGRDNLRALGRVLGVADAGADRALARTGLSDRARDRYSTYSLGMKQRLGVAAALLGNPSLLVLDEPANGLDPLGIIEMRNLLRELAAEGITVFLSSHILAEVSQVCDRVGIVRSGRLLLVDRVADLLARDVPYIVDTPTPELAQQALAQMAGASGLRLEHGAVVLEAGGFRGRDLLSRLAEAGVTVDGLRRADITLEEIFLRLTEPGAGAEATSSGPDAAAPAPAARPSPPLPAGYRPEPLAAPGAPRGLAWGLPDGSFAHRRGLITKAEVRAVALGKLALPAAGVLWDVGAGSGSVSVECDRLAPGLDVYAVDRPPAGSRGGGDDLEANTAGTGVRVVWGSAPEVLATLPDPDRVFVGGGGLDVLDAVLGRLRPGGVVVATYAAMDRAAAAASRLGQVVQVSVSRGVPVGPDGALRLAALNPVFVCWGPG